MKSSVRGLYFHHTPKCGGQSVRAVFDRLGISYIGTEQLKPNRDSYRLVKEGLRSGCIIHGHARYLATGTCSEEKQYWGRIVRHLYCDYNMIMPTRRPERLMGSWMSYNVKKAEEIRRRFIAGSRILSNKEKEGRDPEMFF